MMIKKEDSLRAKTKTPATSLLLITGAKVWYRKMLFPKLYIDYIIYYRFSTENYRKKNNGETSQPLRFIYKATNRALYHESAMQS